MKKYKILIEKDGEYFSPFQQFRYGKLEEFLGINMATECSMSDNDCDAGFYATDLDGLIYTNLSRKGSTVFEMEMGGENKRFDQFKHRFSEQKFVRIVPTDEAKELVKTVDVGYNLHEALFPFNPLQGPVKTPTDTDIQNLKLWCSVWAFAWTSVGDSVVDPVETSVWTSVWTSVRDSVLDSVWASVRGSVRAYVGSLFPNVKTWKYVDHEEGKYPFQPAVDLWHAGFVPVKIDSTWVLLSGKNAEIVYKLE